MVYLLSFTDVFKTNNPVLPPTFQTKFLFLRAISRQKSIREYLPDGCKVRKNSDQDALPEITLDSNS